MNVGGHVVDRNAAPEDQDLAIVVNLPPVEAREWDVDGTATVAEWEGNEQYPDDDRVVCVVFGPERLREEFPEWEGDGAIPLSAVRDSGVPFYTFPESRLQVVENPTLHMLYQALADRVDAVERRPEENAIIVQWLGEEFRVTPEGKVEPDEGLLAGRLADAVEEVVDA